MKTSEIFDELLQNLKVGERSAMIASRRDEITKALNKEFRSIFGSTDYRLMVGSYGRHTAIRRVSDLDMVFILPSKLRSVYQIDGGSRCLLTRVRATLSLRFPRTDIRVDQCVVRVQFSSEAFAFEVQPAFENEDGSFDFPDTGQDRFRVTKPRAEMTATKKLNDRTANAMRNLARMVRAWKDTNGVAMGGLVIDTLVHRFLVNSGEYDNVNTGSYDVMVRDFFHFLANEPDRAYYLALGSNQQVTVTGPFQAKAQNAYRLCKEAFEAEDERAARKRWREIFGPAVSLRAVETVKAFRNTEEFVEEKCSVDIRYELKIDCEVTQKGWRPKRLSEMLRTQDPLLPQRELRFTIERCTAPEPYEVRWKVLNRGVEAERRDMIRGAIIPPNNGKALREHSDFRGDHFVEGYILKDGVIVARDRVGVPIRVTDR